MSEGGIAGFALTRAAPAKINLALHVVGQRADGHHLLESLVTFADRGDRIGLSPAVADRFTVSGPFAAELPLDASAQGGNLVLKARDLLRAELRLLDPAAAGPVHLHLEKNLPLASGIGGGSADAAATLRALLELWGAAIEPSRLDAIALRLGADVPMCLNGSPLLAKGIGEEISPLSDFPSLAMVLVNPLVAVSTPVVFRTLKNKTNPRLALPRAPETGSEWLSAMASMRNDLQPPAESLEPVIGAVCQALGETGAALARMSGSGATCFGIFENDEGAERAAGALSVAHPGWYVLACKTTGKGA
ncbi:MULTISPECIES: 4-(cytidine 5'-diphospho)-2-C-methyl-D-erythritol kinase [unclassified Ensifer]|uniref:4-(cytidine 5'-diphospho)-2-C-methyl-D-erythritol kinase n=1 Tax=unclassified Ensifer TaxID=2633371 RepID=UPI0008134B84|nr:MULTISPECIES: 4-(cytidine 5'-diphospho)-2-C-methyl-D-erythritol kinase [unclassified Ensifer]OCP00274.1 4-(cytidine 5'-diphospho)-2-C-methyl-D-erythritol kinase [Ensifer sp. LC14]OCP07333.1 4-(cytidine 5'-diphospho)-2-C-methyl-D-erythritol kinase [Ensifer sp. LC11]OCP08087.1 4-(cytidine 5'-diphospho)-2-C-methyl-D-erythritol kinase [Ensifer sp. LC13]OCP31923.1 4-(cytidine 5'-diphospho)-2-C-methyl-D-erythritol kinase [Ensifer sp. LC499]